MRVDRFAQRPDLVHSSIPWTPTDPAPLSQPYLEAVHRYLTGDRETVRQQRGTGPRTAVGALTGALTHPFGETSPTEHSRHVTPDGETAGGNSHGSSHAMHGPGALTFPPVSVRTGEREPGVPAPW